MGTNVLNERRRTVVVVPLSSAPQAAPPVLVPVVCMGHRALAVVDQVRAVAKERLARRMGEISPGDLASVEEALRMVLEL
jgi:mRNA-degrading endonuclease toxin of MazEF toxin-antitoxin module